MVVALFMRDCVISDPRTTFLIMKKSLLNKLSSSLRQIPFYKPSMGLEEENAVIDCIRSGWLTTGSLNQRFEEQIQEYINDDVQVCCVNSATAGLHLALDSLNIGPGDEVILPSLTFTATAEVIRHVGAKPVFTDVDFDSLNITPAHVISKITPATKAVIVVHFAGLPVQLDEIISICKDKDIFVIEDAAHAFGTNYNNKKIGSSNSDAIIFSFYANKNITTGEGGALVTKSKQIASKVRISRSHGIDKNTLDRYKSAQNLDYDVIHPGYKYNLTDIAAAIGLVQLSKCDKFTLKRKMLAKSYAEKLAKTNVRFFFSEQSFASSSFHILPIWVASELRDGLVEHLTRVGVTTSLHYKPLHLMTYWKQFCHGQSFANSEKYYSGAVTLPLFPDMSQSDVDYVCNNILQYLENSSE